MVAMLERSSLVAMLERSSFVAILKTVSYTHLDVYKRQVFHRPRRSVGERDRYDREAGSADPRDEADAWIL